MAGRGLPARPYWRMNPGGGRLERDEAGWLWGTGGRGWVEASPAVPGVVWGGFVARAFALEGAGLVDGTAEAFFVVQWGWAAGLERTQIPSRSDASPCRNRLPNTSRITPTRSTSLMLSPSS